MEISVGTSRASFILITLASFLTAVVFSAIHYQFRDISELLKDSLEPFALAPNPISLAVQHNLLFSALGGLTVFAMGRLIEQYARTQNFFQTTLQNLRLWFIFLAGASIVGTIFYHAYLD